MYVVAQRVGAGEIGADEAVRELESERGAEGVVTQTGTSSDPTTAVRAVFRAAAPAAEFAAAAAVLRASHPRIATLLETYGGERHG